MATTKAETKDSSSTNGEFKTTGKKWDGKEYGSYVQQLPFEFATTVPGKSATASPIGAWSEVDPTTIKVRGPTYLDDGIKINAPGAYTFLGMDMYKQADMVEHVMKRPDNVANRLIASYTARGEKAPFVFCVNFLMPWGQIIGYWSSMNSTPYIGDSKFDKLMAAFLSGDDEYRNDRFKIIPRMVEGNWAVKRAVGEKPAIIGKKLTHKYFKGDGYFEVNCDVQSSKIAKGILMVVYRYCKSVTVDLCFLFEAKSEDELPERMLGGLRFHNLDPELAPKMGPAPVAATLERKAST